MQGFHFNSLTTGKITLCAEYIQIAIVKDETAIKLYFGVAGILK